MEGRRVVLERIVLQGLGSTELSRDDVGQQHINVHINLSAVQGVAEQFLRQLFVQRGEGGELFIGRLSRGQVTPAEILTGLSPLMGDVGALFGQGGAGVGLLSLMEAGDGNGGLRGTVHPQPPELPRVGWFWWATGPLECPWNWLGCLGSTACEKVGFVGTATDTVRRLLQEKGVGRLFVFMMTEGGNDGPAVVHPVAKRVATVLVVATVAAAFYLRHKLKQARAKKMREKLEKELEAETDFSEEDEEYLDDEETC